MNVTENTQVLIPYGIDPRAQEPILDQALKTALDDEYKPMKRILVSSKHLERRHHLLRS